MLVLMANYVGRFAPSPTGPLHFGSLVAALASWLDARAAGGRWLVRIEDLDGSRTQPGAAESILRSLERMGLHWDGDIMRQSTRTDHYRDALQRLTRDGHIYPCACTRREIADSRAPLAPDGAQIYPGTCRAGLAPGRAARAQRLRTGAETVRFTDRVQGEVAQALAQAIGDFVLWRADGQYAYQLAVVVDDFAQGITDIVRGADLIESTARQIYLQRLLGYSTPRYAHVPVALGAQGEKLSKQTGAAPMDERNGAQNLLRALDFLGMPAPAGISTADLLPWARLAWSVARVPRRLGLRGSV